jgi:hypothetical protein
MTETSSRPAFRTAADADVLLRGLIDTPVGAIFDFGAASRLIGKPVTGGTAALQNALRRARDDHALEFGSVIGVGYKRLSDEEIVAASARDMERSHRGAQRAARKLGNVQNFDALPAEAQVKHNAALAVFGVIGAATSGTALRRVEEATAKAKKGLPMADTLKALGLAAS